jgi:hypothetical protein
MKCTTEKQFPRSSRLMGKEGGEKIDLSGLKHLIKNTG